MFLPTFSKWPEITIDSALSAAEIDCSYISKWLSSPNARTLHFFYTTRQSSYANPNPILPMLFYSSVFFSLFYSSVFFSLLYSSVFFFWFQLLFEQPSFSALVVGQCTLHRLHKFRDQVPCFHLSSSLASILTLFEISPCLSTLA